MKYTLRRRIDLINPNFFFDLTPYRYERLMITKAMVSEEEVKEIEPKIGTFPFILLFPSFMCNKG